MIISSHKTNRQWPENLIMPVNARAKMSYLLYGVAEGMLKQMLEDGQDFLPSVEKLVDWLVNEAVKMWCNTDTTMQNAIIYRGVASQDMLAYAEKLWRK